MGANQATSPNISGDHDCQLYRNLICLFHCLAQSGAKSHVVGRMAGLGRDINAWSGVLALLGYAAVYLNRPGKKLAYLNDAVLPYYIVHQSFIVVLAFVLTYQLGPVIEPLLVIAGTICRIYSELRNYSSCSLVAALVWFEMECGNNRSGREYVHHFVSGSPVHWLLFSCCHCAEAGYFLN